MKIVRIYVEDLMAGDTLVVKEGSIRKFYHVCEIQQHQNDILYIYDLPHGQKKAVHAQADDIVRVRE